MAFDAIVIGSGMSGGIAAKELTERGLKVLVIERGKMIDPAKDYMDHLMPWELPNNNQMPEDEVAEHWPVQSKCYAFGSATSKFFAKDSEQPLSTPDDKPFAWIKGDHLGGRSVMWVSNTFRMEYAAAQATKLAIIDAAFDACFRGASADTVKQAKAYQRV